VVMPHNLIIVDYTLGHPGSVHDTYSFRSTHLHQQYDTLLPDDHWVWADSAYPLERWCIVPFKKPWNGRLTRDQRAFNYHLSTHAFAALKGQFQSLQELCLNIHTERELLIAVHWIMCCIILHNMIIRFKAHHPERDPKFHRSQR
ncbi:hypothetical protein P692DRAFT_201704896, partial [Suillus brevipes Sb2]